MDHEALARDIMKAALDGMPPEELRKQGWLAKVQLLDELNAMMRSQQLIDSTVQAFAFDPAWQWGWLQLNPTSPTAGAPPTSAPSRTTRGERILAIAEELAADADDGIVESKAVAERLMSEGDRGSLKDISTAVGNTLARSDLWVKERAGEYRRADVRVVPASADISVEEDRASA